MGDGPPSRQRRLAFWSCLVALSLGVVWLVTDVPYLPTNDGPQHVLMTHMAAHFTEPGSIYAQQFDMQLQLGASGFAFVYGPLYDWFGWDRALTIFECLLLVALGLAVVALTRALAPRRMAAGLLAFGFVFCWVFYLGFFPFLVGTTIGLALLAFVCRQRPMSNVERAGVSVGMLLQFQCHAFSAVVTGLLLAAVVLVRAWSQSKQASRAEQEHGEPPASWRSELLWLTATGAPLIGLLGYISVRSASLGDVAHTSSLEFLSLAELRDLLPHLLAPGPSWRGLVALAIIALSLVTSASPAGRRRARIEEKTLAVCATVSLLVGCFGPLHVPGWQYVSPRLLLTTLLLSIALLPTERLHGRVPGLVTLFGCGAGALALLVGLRDLDRRLFEGCGDAYAGLQAPLKRSFMQLPITFDATCGLPPTVRSEVPYLQAGIHFGALYAVAHGGGTPWTFVGDSPIHAFSARQTVLAPRPPIRLWGIGLDASVVDSPERRAETLDVAMSFATHYENLVVNGATPSDIAQLERRGFVADFARGTHFNGQLHPCRVRVRVAASQTEPAPLVQYSLAPSDVPVLQARAARHRDGYAEATLATLCGPLWIRVPLPDDERCRAADERGRIAFVATTEDHVLTCER